MSGSGAEPKRRSLAALSFVLLAPLAACSDGDEPVATVTSTPAAATPEVTATPSAATEETSSAPPTITAPRNVIAEVTATLDARATALQFKDATAFMDSVASADAAFVADQQQYWANVSQLPLAEVSYVLDPASVVRTGDRFEAIVDLHLELNGYDAQPALSRGRMEFARSPRGLVISAAQTGDGQNGGGAQPWDLGPIEVRSQGGALGIFDAGSVAAAPAMLSSVGQGITQVSKQVPSSALGRGAVFYALSDLTFMESLEQVRGDAQDKADGLTFTVAGVGQGPAASRFVLDPSAVYASVQARDRLVRHELTHVATGPLGDAVPLWLSEGTAEWVSVQAIKPSKRSLGTAAMDAAEQGLTQLPADSAFTGDRSKASYGVSWWACEYIAATYGDRAVWLLISEFQRAGAGADQAQVVRQLLGIPPQRIARGAGQMIMKQYRPAPEETRSADPSESPTPSSGQNAPRGSTDE